MLMTRIRNDTRDETGRLVPAFRQRPTDFEQTFVAIGRQACEEHYGVGRRQVTRWLEQCGLEALTSIRAAYVKRKEAERHERNRLSRRDMGKILATVYHVQDRRYVSPAIAQRAARYLRIVRNGGWIISPAGNGLWRVGLHVRSAAELVDMAKRAGFDPSLTGGE